MQFLYVCAFCCSFQVPGDQYLAADDVSADQRALAGYLLDGWKTERERVCCGSFTLTSEFHEIAKDGTPTGKSLPPLDRATSLRIRFDCSRGFEEQVHYEDTEVAGYHALHPDVRIFAPDLLGGTVDKYARDATPHLTCGRCLFDWRASGCFDTDAIRLDGVTVDTFLSRFREFMHIVAVHPEERPGRYTIEARGEISSLTTTDGMVERTTIDESAGFSIVSRTFHICALGDEDNAATMLPDYAVRCEWQQNADVWVPTVLHFSEPWVQKGGMVRLDWHTVNDCSATEDTSIEGSVLPDNLVLGDLRVDGPVLTVGLLGDLRADARGVIKAPPEPRIGRRGYLIWIVNLAVLLAAGGWWMWRAIQARWRNH